MGTFDVGKVLCFGKRLQKQHRTTNGGKLIKNTRPTRTWQLFDNNRDQSTMEDGRWPVAGGRRLVADCWFDIHFNDIPLIEIIEINQNQSKSIKINQNQSKSIKINQNQSKSIKIDQCLSA